MGGAGTVSAASKAVSGVLGQNGDGLNPSQTPAGHPKRRVGRTWEGGGEAGQCEEEVSLALERMGGVGDAGWAMLPMLLACVVGSKAWQEGRYLPGKGASSNNLHCLVR